MPTIEIAFKTIEIPAPFAHEYRLKLEVDQAIKASYQITYLGREDLSEEEIALEGFTGDDDFEWSGVIDASWKPIIQSLLAVHSADHEQSNEFSQTELTLTGTQDGHQTTMVFYDYEELEYKIQEIVQALFETSKREAPLKLYFKSVEAKLKSHFQVEVSFATRTCHVTKDNQPHRQLKWKEGKYLMSLIYQPDYLLDPVKPNKPGFYLSFDKQIWFNCSEVAESEKLPGFEQELRKYL